MSDTAAYAVVADEASEEKVVQEEGLKSPVDKSTGCKICLACGGCCGLSVLSLLLFVLVSNLTARPTSDDVSVFLDGWTQTPVPRKLISGNTSELVYEWNITESGMGIDVEGDGDVSRNISVFFPFAKMLQANFSRTNHLAGVKESGVSRHIWSPNPLSVFGDTVQFGLMEKMHVRSFEGRWTQRSMEYVREKRRRRGRLTRWLAGMLREVRGVLVHMFLFQQTGLLGAFLDEDLMASSAAHVRNNSGIPTAPVRHGMANMIQELERPGATLPKYELSACSCFHFDKDPAIDLTEDGVHLPLDRMLISHRGQTVFAPRQEFSMNTGVSVLKLDASGEMLRLYYIANAEYIMNDLLDEEAEPPTFFVAPSDFGSERYAAPDSRPQGDGIGKRSWVAWTIHQLYSSIPLDYEYLHMGADELCPESINGPLSATLESKNMEAFVKSEKTLAQGFSLARLFCRASRCGTEYLGAGSNEESPSFEIDNMHGYDILEAAVWSHGFLELPQHVRAFALTNREWNTFPAP